MSDHESAPAKFARHLDARGALPNWGCAIVARLRENGDYTWSVDVISDGEPCADTFGTVSVFVTVPGCFTDDHVLAEGVDLVCKKLPTATVVFVHADSCFGAPRYARGPPLSTATTKLQLLAVMGDMASYMVSGQAATYITTLASRTRNLYLETIDVKFWSSTTEGSELHEACIAQAPTFISMPTLWEMMYHGSMPWSEDDARTLYGECTFPPPGVGVATVDG